MKVRTNTEKCMQFIAGPCVIESERFTKDVALELREQLKGLPLTWTFKASFDKANRSSLTGFRGPGLKEGLRILGDIKDLGIPVLSDVHETWQAEHVAEVVDVLQIPAFLSRQTDLLLAVGRAALNKGCSVNVKKGQFLSPWDMQQVADKLFSLGPGLKFYFTERGVSFGYQRLVVDMSSFAIMKSFGVETIFDATHSVQQPGLMGKSSGGNRALIEPLARAAMGAGADGLFIECHPDPAKALSAGPNAFWRMWGILPSKCWN
jgi:2-dehydro-3-deoxyphosphooctonate aldolase (KDO 8-P synthase)